MTNPTNNSPQDNRDRVSEDAARSLQNILNSVRTAVENEFAIQQMEYDELYGVDSEEYETYQNKIGAWLKSNKLIDMVADLLPLSLMMDMASPSSTVEVAEPHPQVENPWVAPAEPAVAQTSTAENPWAVPAQESYAEAESEQSYQSGAYPEPVEAAALADNPWGQPEAQPQAQMEAQMEPQAQPENPWGQPEAQPQAPMEAQMEVQAQPENPWGQPEAQPQAPIEAQAQPDNPWGQPQNQAPAQAQLDNPWAAPPQQAVAYQDETSVNSNTDNSWAQNQEVVYAQAPAPEQAEITPQPPPIPQQAPAQPGSPWGSPPGVDSVPAAAPLPATAPPQNPWGSPPDANSVAAPEANSNIEPQATPVSSGAWQDISEGSIPAVQQAMPGVQEQPAAPSLDALFPQSPNQQQEQSTASDENGSYLPSQAWMSSDPDMQPTMPMPPPPPPIPPAPGPEYTAESTQYPQGAQPAMNLDAIGDDQFGDLEDDTTQSAEQAASSFMPPTPPPMPPVPPSDPSAAQPATEEQEEDKFKFDPSSAWG